MKFKTRSQAIKETGVSYVGRVNASSKLIKNTKVNQIETYCIYLAPANISGYNLCSHSTPECRLGCLNTSGRAAVELKSNIHRISNSRVIKSRLFVENTEFFMDWIITEIEANKILSNKKGFDFAVRLNGTSDIDWANVNVFGKNIFELFPDIQFYDYTKNPNKFKNIASNYHLTFSYSGRNWAIANKLLKQGQNVAVVFDVNKDSELPETFNGYEVINGDLTDYRPFDPKGVIVGLKWKKIADKQTNDYIRNSCFVVKVNDQKHVIDNGIACHNKNVKVLV
jgi:hypothetical protein